MGAFAIASIILLAGLTIPCLAGKSFVDDFEDGDHTDGAPVAWGAYAAPFDDGTVAIVDGSLVLTPFTSGPPTTGASNYWEVDTFAVDQQYHDVSILTQVRGLTPGASSLVGIGGLDTEATEGWEGSGAWGYLLLDGGTRQLVIGHNVDTAISTATTVSTPLSHIDNELNMRFTIRNLDVSLSAWPVGTPEPPPQVRTVLPASFTGREGHVTLFAGGRSTVAPVAFRFVDVNSNPVSDAPWFLPPTSEYALQDDGSGGTRDDLGDQAKGFNGFVGEVDYSIDILNFEQRLIEKFSLPATPGLAGRLREATLLVYGQASQNVPTGPLSVYHSISDNDAVREASDYENMTYVDTQLDVMQPTDQGEFQYFEIDVTSFVLADLMNDEENPMSAFRLQVDEAIFVEDNISHFYSLSTSSSHNPAMLRLMIDSVAVGDFNGDGMYNVADVDLLTRQIAASANEPEFDITGDDLVNINDLTRWLSVAAGENGFSEAFVQGDTNLDGVVDFTDFVNLNNNWQATTLNNETPVAWSAGDFDGNGIVEFADFVAQNNNWQRAIASARAAAVPEPSAVTLLIFSVVLAKRRRQSIG
jgi:hypothetical protein